MRASRSIVVAAALVAGGAACQRDTRDAPPPAPAMAPPVEDLRRPTQRPIAVSDLPRFPRDMDHPIARYPATPPDAIREHFAAMHARSCGVIEWDAPKADAIAAFTCAQTALAAQQPFVYVHEQQGMDSGVETGLVGAREGSAYVTYLLTFDSDPCGGGCGYEGHTELSRCALDFRAGDCLPTGEYCYGCADEQVVDRWTAGTLTAQSTADAEAVLPRLIGATPASLGPAFAGVVIGATATANQAAIARANDALAVGGVALLEVGKVIADVAPDGDQIDIHVYGRCGAFRDRVVAAWGASRDLAWLDAASGQRAHLDLESCRLHVERYTSDLDAWLAGLLHLYGANGAALRARMRASDHGLDFEDPASLDWTEPGIGRAGSRAQLSVSIRHGVVTRVGMRVRTDPETREALRAKLIQLRGKPTTDDTNEDQHATVWTTAPVTSYATEKDGTADLDLGAE